MSRIQKKSKINKKLLKISKETSEVDIAKSVLEKRRNIQKKPASQKKIKIKKIKTVKNTNSPKPKVNKKSKFVSFSNYKSKINIKKTILLLIIFAVISFAILFINNRHILGITIKTEVNQKDSVVIDLATGNNKMYSYGNEILVYYNGIIKTYNKYGKKTWEYKFEEMFNPDIDINGKYLQITNKENGYIYIFENKYEVSRIKINGEIKSANINKKGYTCAIYSSSGIKAAIGVYNKKGKEEYRVKLTSANIVNYKLSDDLKYLAFTDVVMQGISITENINLIDTDNINKINTIKILKSEMVNELYIIGNNIDISTDTAIYRYNINSKKELEEKLNNKNITYVNYKNKTISFLSKKTDDDAKSQLTIKKIGGIKEKKVAISDVPKNLKYTDNLSYVVYQKRIDVYNNFGKKIKGYTSENIITDVKVFNLGKSIGVSYSNKIEIINI